MCAPDISATSFEFTGKHLLMTYHGCDYEALIDHEGLTRALRRAVDEAGATLLEEASYQFAPNGLTIVMLLSESHASIHTYPEYRSCFVDLFTCGQRCRPEAFDRILSAYLRPDQANRRLLTRSYVSKEDSWIPA
jgi:S-adenosylmethionine decarboxylase proenzyme